MSVEPPLRPVIPWRFGVLFGALVALVVATVFTAWDWWTNPGGIFRDGDGTNWHFVSETAISWLLPTFLYLAPILVVGRWLWGRIRLH